MKGIVIDGMITEGEYPYYEAARLNTGNFNIKPVSDKKTYDPQRVMGDAEKTKEARYARRVARMTPAQRKAEVKRLFTPKTRARAPVEAAPPIPAQPAPARRRRRGRGDAEVIAAAMLTGERRTRSGREH